MEYRYRDTVYPERKRRSSSTIESFTLSIQIYLFLFHLLPVPKLMLMVPWKALWKTGWKRSWPCSPEAIPAGAPPLFPLCSLLPLSVRYPLLLLDQDFLLLPGRLLTRELEVSHPVDHFHGSESCWLYL